MLNKRQKAMITQRQKQTGKQIEFNKIYCTNIIQKQKAKRQKTNAKRNTSLAKQNLLNSKKSKNKILH